MRLGLTIFLLACFFAGRFAQSTSDSSTASTDSTSPPTSTTTAVAGTDASTAASTSAGTAASTDAATAASTAAGTAVTVASTAAGTGSTAAAGTGSTAAAATGSTAAAGTGSTAAAGTGSTAAAGTGSTAAAATGSTAAAGTGSTASGATTAAGSTVTTVTTVATTVSTTTSAAQALIRKSVWLICDPHLYSWNKSYEFCNFTGPQTCLSTPGLTIMCTATAVSGLSVTYLSALTFTFTNNGTTKTYTVSDPTTTLTPQFSDGSTTVLNSKNSSWLKMSMSTNTTTSSSISIIDKYTSTTIMLSQWRTSNNAYKMYNLIVLMTSGSLTNSTGILIGGCPSSPSGRRRRSLSVFQEARAASDCAGVTDPTLNAVCNADVGATGNAALAGGTSIAAETITTAQAIDAATFNAAISSFGIGVNLSLFSIFAFNVYFFFF